MSFVLFVWLLAAGIGCSTPPARAEQARPTSASWHELGSWQGEGSRQTESFDVTNGALRLRWEARAAAGATDGQAHLKVWLYSAISGRPLQLIVDHAGAGSGTAYAADDPRVSYLLIEADRTQWMIGLDEAMATR